MSINKKSSYVDPKTFVGALVKPRYAPCDSSYFGLVTGTETKSLNNTNSVYREYCVVYWMNKKEPFDLVEQDSLEILSK
jgi:hypothetical protein